MNLVEAAKDALHIKKIGDVTIKKPFFMSKKWLAMIILPFLVLLNRKLELNLSEADLSAVAVAVAAYIVGQAWEDGKVKTAAITNGEE